MAWKEVNLLADLATVYDLVSPNPVVVEAQDDKGITRKLVNVFEAGKSAGDNKNIGYRKNIEYYVYHAGLGDERAFYAVNEPKNNSDQTAQTANGSLEAYSRIFANEKLRSRTLGAIMKKSASFIAAGTPGSDLNWSLDAIKAPLKYLDPFMSLLSANAQVRADGAAISDANLESAVTSSLTSVKTAFGF